MAKERAIVGKVEAVVEAGGRVVRKLVGRGRECVGVLEAVGGCDEEEGKTRDGLNGRAFMELLILMDWTTLA